MSLRVKTVFILLSIFVLYGSLTYLVQREIVFPSFVALEQEEAAKNMQRVLRAIGREIEVLRASANDWSMWSDTYRYVEGQNQEYEADNLGASTLAAMQLSLMNLYDRQGNLNWGLGYDLTAGEEISLGELSRQRLPPDHPLLAAPLADDYSGGIDMTPHGPMLLVSNPVLTNEGEGPSAGALLMGRLLNTEAVARLAEQAQLRLAVTPLPQSEVAAAWATGVSGPIPSSPLVLEAQDQTIDVSTVIADIGQTPALRLMVEVPRDITARGRDAMSFALVSLIGVGLVVLMVLMALLQRTVFHPVTLLTRHAVRIGEEDDLSSRIGLNRRDEIGVLAREFDRMLERCIGRPTRLFRAPHGTPPQSERRSVITHEALVPRSVSRTVRF